MGRKFFIKQFSLIRECMNDKDFDQGFLIIRDSLFFVINNLF